MVDAEPIELAAGVYRVLLAGSPPKTFERVEVTGGDDVRIDLAASSR
jgi:hypothetical protein